MTHILILEARFYEEISDKLAQGAIEVLEQNDVTYERVSLPGALEIPGAVQFGALRESEQPFDGYIALGCVIRGETSHYDIVAGESARGLMEVGLKHGLCIGNGILTCENRAQAMVRADKAQKNKGAGAAQAALAMINFKEQCGLTE